jgi:hypothetical protein
MTVATVPLYARRISYHAIELLCPLEITVQAIAFMARDADTLGVAAFWMLDATQATDFDPDALNAVQEAVVWAYRSKNTRLRRVVVVHPVEYIRDMVESRVRGPVIVKAVETRAEAATLLGLQ